MPQFDIVTAGVQIITLFIFVVIYYMSSISNVILFYSFVSKFRLKKLFSNFQMFNKTKKDLNKSFSKKTLFYKRII